MPERPSSRARAEEEVSLIELYRMIARRKRWAFACVVLSISVGVLYLLLTAPVYEARVKVHIGQVAGPTLLEPAETLASRLLARHGEYVADGVKRERPFLERATVQRGATATIELVAEAYRPADAADFLNHVFGEIQESHAEIYHRNIDLLTQRVKNLETQHAALLRQYDAATLLLNQLKSRDPVQASLVAIERGRISSLINELDAEKPLLAMRLTPPQAQPTEMLGTIVPPTKSAAPRKALVLGIATLLGMIGGVILAFIVEFAKGLRGKTA